jgi:hypothetical protein
LLAATPQNLGGAKGTDHGPTPSFLALVLAAGMICGRLGWRQSKAPLRQP